MASSRRPAGTLTMEEAAKYLNITRYWLSVLRKRGFFAAHIPSMGRILFTKKQLDAGRKEYEMRNLPSRKKPLPRTPYARPQARTQTRAQKDG